IHAVSGAREDLARMPKKREPLSGEQIGLLRAWIDQGAVWPETAATGAKDPRGHWAFQPPTRPGLPGVKNARWSRNPIDRFILQRLEREKLKPSAQADKASLLGRLSL